MWSIFLQKYSRTFEVLSKICISCVFICILMEKFCSIIRFSILFRLRWLSLSHIHTHYVVFCINWHVAEIQCIDHNNLPNEWKKKFPFHSTVIFFRVTMLLIRFHVALLFSFIIKSTRDVAFVVLVKQCDVSCCIVHCI